MRLFDVDPFLGVKQFIEYDHATDSITIQSVQDCTAIIERNKALQNDNSHWKNQAKNDDLGIDMRLLACIPAIVEEKWMREYGVRLDQIAHDPDMRKSALRLLNSNEWKWLKASDVTA